MAKETDSEKRARETLIYLNHHACHLVKDSTITSDKPAPTKEDVRDLAKVLDEVRAEERARIVRWLRSYDDMHRRSALADRIERGEHESRQA